MNERENDEVIIVTADLVKRLWPDACKEELAIFTRDFPAGVRLEEQSFDAICQYDEHTDYRLLALHLAIAIEAKNIACPCVACCCRSSPGTSRYIFGQLVRALDARIREILAEGAFQDG